MVFRGRRHCKMRHMHKLYARLPRTDPGQRRRYAIALAVLDIYVLDFMINVCKSVFRSPTHVSKRPPLNVHSAVDMQGVDRGHSAD